MTVCQTASLGNSQVGELTQRMLAGLRLGRCCWGNDAEKGTGQDLQKELTVWAQVQVLSYLERSGWDVSCPPSILVLTCLAWQLNNCRLLTGALEQLSSSGSAAFSSD